MKKAVYMGLVLLIMVLVPLFVACATTTQPTSAPTPAQPTATQPAKVFNLKWSTSMAEVEGPSRTANFLFDMIEEKSGGRIKVDRFVGGTLGKSTEHLGLVSSGAVDFASSSITWDKAQLPLHAYMNWGIGGQDKVVDLMSKMNFEIPETKAILDKECEENGIRILTFWAVGQNGIIGKPQFKSLADLKGKKIGTVPNYRALDAMGLITVTMNIPDIYEGLAKGVIDAQCLAIQPMYLLKWHEVTKCFMADGHHSAGQYMLMNLKTWNSLPSDLQQIIMDATAEARKYGAGLVLEDEGKALKAFKDAGLTVGTLPVSDQQEMFRLEYGFRAKDMIDFCTPIGKVEEAKVILKNLDQITGVKSQ